MLISHQRPARLPPLPGSDNMSPMDERATDDRREPTRIERISAVTLITADMARSVAFYTALGFTIRHGGPTASFTSLQAGSEALNLSAEGDRPDQPRWGRIIFYVSDVDAFYQKIRAAGFAPEMPPEDAPWGERYFHLTDPDGHELSFARPLS